MVIAHGALEHAQLLKTTTEGAVELAHDTVIAKEVAFKAAAAVATLVPCII